MVPVPPMSVQKCRECIKYLTQRVPEEWGGELLPRSLSKLHPEFTAPTQICPLRMHTVLARCGVIPQSGEAAAVTDDGHLMTLAHSKLYRVTARARGSVTEI